jgi:NhaP-type Na+/H+ or K+/H+ antiporter
MFMLYFNGSLTSTKNIFVKNDVIIVIFVAVVALGTGVQLLLLPRLSKRIANAKENAKMRAKRAKKNKFDVSNGLVPKTTTWRTS